MSEAFAFTSKPPNDTDSLNALEFTNNNLLKGLNLEDDSGEASD